MYLPLPFPINPEILLLGFIVSSEANEGSSIGSSYLPLLKKEKQVKVENTHRLEILPEIVERPAFKLQLL